MSALFPPLRDETRRAIELLPGLIEKTFPMPGHFRAGLKRDVAELSRLLTSDRTERNNSYLGRPAALSAYLRYFLPWNVYRLCRLFAALTLNLKSGDAVNDLGAGPLTLTASLWISRPDLRSVPLEFRCVDRTAAALEAGKKLFAALAAATGNGSESPSGCPWTVKTIRGEIGRNGRLSTEIKGKPAALSAAVNVYNELFWDFSPMDADGLGRFAARQARLLSSLTESGGSVLAVEPGIPRSGEFVSLLRASLMNEGRVPLAPCVHRGPCPLPGKALFRPDLRSERSENKADRYGAGQGGSGPLGKAKWCHFAFDAEDAPEELRKLSAAAQIPKERAVLSFIFAGPVSAEAAARNREPAKTRAAISAAMGAAPIKANPARVGPVKIRVISDSFPVDGNAWGRYGCSERGLALVRGSRAALEASASGALEELPPAEGLKDAKSGAFVAEKN